MIIQFQQQKTWVNSLFEFIFKEFYSDEKDAVFFDFAQQLETITRGLSLWSSNRLQYKQVLERFSQETDEFLPIDKNVDEIIKKIRILHWENTCE